MNAGRQPPAAGETQAVSASEGYSHSVSKSVPFVPPPGSSHSRGLRSVGKRAPPLADSRYTPRNMWGEGSRKPFWQGLARAVTAGCLLGAFFACANGATVHEVGENAGTGENASEGPGASGPGGSAGTGTGSGGPGDGGDGSSNGGNGQGAASTGGQDSGDSGQAGAGQAGQGAGGSGAAGSGNAADELICDDQLDNDNDVAIDCADADCDEKTCGLNGRVCQSSRCVCPGGAHRELLCGDFKDDDCDGRFDCADSDCEDAPECTGSLCPGPEPLVCGDRITGTTAGGPRNHESVGCNAVGVPGPEKYYSFTSGEKRFVTITLDGDGGLYPDLDLAIVGTTGTDCDPMNNCIAWGWGSTNDEEEDFDADANVTYYVIVDSTLPSGNAFSLVVDCQ